MIDFSQIADIKLNGQRLDFLYANMHGNSYPTIAWQRPYQYPYTVIRFGRVSENGLDAGYGYTDFRDKYGMRIAYTNYRLAQCAFIIYPSDYPDEYKYDHIFAGSIHFPIDCVIDIISYYVKNDTEFLDLRQILSEANTPDNYEMYSPEWTFTEWNNSALDNKVWLWAGKPDENGKLCIVKSTSLFSYRYYIGLALTPDYNLGYVAPNQTVPSCFSIQNEHTVKYIFDEKLRIVDATTPLFTFTQNTPWIATIKDIRTDFSDYVSEYEELTNGEYSKEEYPYLFGVQELKSQKGRLGIDFGAGIIIAFATHR